MIQFQTADYSRVSSRRSEYILVQYTPSAARSCALSLLAPPRRGAMPVEGARPWDCATISPVSAPGIARDTESCIGGVCKSVRGLAVKAGLKGARCGRIAHLQRLSSRRSKQRAPVGHAIKSLLEEGRGRGRHQQRAARTRSVRGKRETSGRRALAGQLLTSRLAQREAAR